MKSTKKETQEQKIERIFKKSLSGVVKNEVSGCSFVGVQFDAKAVEAITMIAEGLKANAKAFGELAGVLKASNVTLETMLKVNG